MSTSIDMKFEIVVIPASDVSETFHNAGVYAGPDEPYLFGRVRVSGPDPKHGSYQSLASFRRAERAHGAHEAKLGKRDESWPDGYAAYMVAEQSGAKLPE